MQIQRYIIFMICKSAELNFMLDGLDKGKMITMDMVAHG